MARYMDRFGFDRKPELDYPEDQMSASGPYLGSRLIRPTSPLVDVGRMGIGQDKLEVVPCRWRRWPRRSPTAAGSWSPT